MAKIQITGGGFQDSEGNLLANGYLKMVLSQDCQVASTAQICSGIEVTVPLDGSGNVSGTVNVWPNDQLLPVNNFYTVTGYTQQGQRAWGPNVQQITGAGPFSLTSWVPNQLVSWVPPIANISGVAPATASSPGLPGQLAYDGTHIYVCVAINTWVRATLATF